MKNYRYIYLQIVAGCLLSGLALTIEAASLYEVEVLVEKLGVREYPTTSSEVVAYMDEGTRTVVSQSDSKDWYFVNSQDKSGYIARNYVKLLRTVITDN